MKSAVVNSDKISGSYASSGVLRQSKLLPVWAALYLSSVVMRPSSLVPPGSLTVFRRLLRSSHRFLSSSSVVFPAMGGSSVALYLNRAVTSLILDILDSYSCIN